MNRQPLLVINVQLNLSYRPQLVVYKDSNLNLLIEDFITQHNLKPTAAPILKQLVNTNLKPKLAHKTNHKNYSQWKTDRGRERSKENNPTSLEKHEREKKVSPRPKSKPRSSLLEMSFSDENRVQHVSEVEKEFQRQFKRVKEERSRVKEESLRRVKEESVKRVKEESLKRVFDELIKWNPKGLSYITPEYINFMPFSADFLSVLEEFFEGLQEEDFVRLDLAKFECLIEKYQYKELFKMKHKFS